MLARIVAKAGVRSVLWRATTSSRLFSTLSLFKSMKQRGEKPKTKPQVMNMRRICAMIKVKVGRDELSTTTTMRAFTTRRMAQCSCTTSMTGLRGR